MLNSAVVFCLRHGGEGTAAAIRWVRRPPCVRVAAVKRSYHGRRKAGFTVPERKPPQRGRFTEGKGQA